MSQEILTCKEWMGKEIYSEEEMRKFSLEEVKQDLKTHGAWDSVSPVVAVVLEVGEGGVIIQTIPSLLGAVDSKYVDGRALWPEAPEESHIKIKNIDLSSLTFRGGLASSYVPGFDWSLRVPSTRTPGKMVVVDNKDVARYNCSSKLWLRAVMQPWKDGKVKILLGLAPCDDIKTIPNYQDPRCPLVEIATFTAPLMPWHTLGLGLPSVPYLLDSREEGGEDFPSSQAVTSAYRGLFKSSSKPQGKKGKWSEAV